MKRLLSALCLALLFVPASQAQRSSFTFSGQLRHRSELDGRDFNGETSPADVHLLRTRLNVTVRPVDRVQTFVQIQDSRRFGAGNPQMARGTMDPTAGQIDVHQTFFVVKDLFDAPLSLKIGRQELVYGNQRLVGSVGWSNVGRSFDGAVLAYSTAHASLDLFAARLVSTAVEGDGSQNLVGLYGTWQLGDRHSLDAYTLLDNDTDDIPDREGNMANELVRVTPGLTLTGSTSGISYTLEAALQRGGYTERSGATRSTIDGSMMSASVQYALDSSGMNVGAGYTRLSGDNTLGDDVLGQFNTLFATNHKFYGYMDYFPGTSAPYGLQDLRVMSTLPVSNQVSLGATLHHFAQTEPTASTETKTLGQELDLGATYTFDSAVTFKTGLSGFLPGKAMEARLGTNDVAVWGYVMSVVNF